MNIILCQTLLLHGRVYHRRRPLYEKKEKEKVFPALVCYYNGRQNETYITVDYFNATVINKCDLTVESDSEQIFFFFYSLLHSNRK